MGLDVFLRSSYPFVAECLRGLGFCSLPSRGTVRCGFPSIRGQLYFDLVSRVDGIKNLGCEVLDAPYQPGLALSEGCECYGEHGCEAEGGVDVDLLQAPDP